MKGLDGIQGPIYVGTGCVFRRQALYGFDAPKTKKPPLRTCNCLPKWTYCGCCCSGRKKKKSTKLKLDKLKHPGKDDEAHEGVKEGNEGNLVTLNFSLQSAHLYYSLYSEIVVCSLHNST